MQLHPDFIITPAQREEALGYIHRMAAFIAAGAPNRYLLDQLRAKLRRWLTLDDRSLFARYMADYRDHIEAELASAERMLARKANETEARAAESYVPGMAA